MRDHPLTVVVLASLGFGLSAFDVGCASKSPASPQAEGGAPWSAGSGGAAQAGSSSGGFGARLGSGGGAVQTGGSGGQAQTAGSGGQAQTGGTSGQLQTGGTGGQSQTGGTGGQVQTGGTSSGGAAGTGGSSSPTPKIFEQFNPPYNGVWSPDGAWRIAGTWVGTGGNTLRPSNAQVVSTYAGQSGGFLLLTVPANVLEGAEIQTDPNNATYSYGYYEVRMRVTSVSGTCVSFFWKEVNYGPGEIDIEFLTNESWITSASSGQVHYTIHPNWDVYGTAYAQSLSFNPSKDFHRYGFLWTSSKIAYTVDGQVVKTFTNPPAANIANTKGGYIMMNTWTGSPNWGGGPPTQAATSAYDWVKYYPGLTYVPTG